MTEITVEQIEENFDEIMERVSDGEHFLIKSNEGNVVMVPYEEYSDYFNEYFNHDEAP